MQRIAAEYVRESASLDGGSAIYDNAQDLESRSTSWLRSSVSNWPASTSSMPTRRRSARS